MSIKVSMIVWNEFLNDARVLKEAETLTAAGYDVIVHALKLQPSTTKQVTLDSGIEIQRVSHTFFSGKLKRFFVSFGKSTTSNSGVDKNPGSQPRHSRAVKQVSFLRRVYLLSTRMFTHLRLAAAMIRANPDVVHSHDVNTLPTAWLVKVFTRARLVYDAHEISTDREGYASFRNFVARVEKFITPKAALTMTTTDTRAKFFARAYGIKRPLVLQNRPRYSVPQISNRIREELAITDELPIVLYQGGIQQGRGLRRIVDAAKLVTDAHFVFIGGGRLEQPLKDKVNALGLGHKVHFIPTVALAELPSYTSSADIGVQAIENTCLNHFSTDSNKLFEYLIAGLPIVATNMPEIRKIVQQYEFGHIVTEGNTEELAQAVQSLVNNVAEREEFAKNARKAAKVLNWDAQEKAFVDAYKEVIDVEPISPSIEQSVEDTIS